MHFLPVSSYVSPLPSPLLPKYTLNSDPANFVTTLGSSRGTYPPTAASLPSPPMSGTPPPPTPPNETSGLRRKRSESFESSQPPPQQPRYVQTRAPYPQDLRQHEFQPRYPGPPPPLLSSYPPVYPPPSAYQQGYAGGFVAGPVPIQQPSFLAPPATLLSQQDIPSSSRVTRKPKAHVASACVNCKKKHLRCDNARPCRRCVQSGKEDSCVDVTHKKRGRPPLKAEDGQSRRPYETSLGSLTTPTITRPSEGGPSGTSGSYLFPHSASLPNLGGVQSHPGPSEERRRPPPLFQSIQPPPPTQQYASGQLTPSAPSGPGHRPFPSQSSSSSSARPLSPYFTSPPYSPQQSRFDPYGRPYAPPAGYASLTPAPQVSPRPQQYQSISSVTYSGPLRPAGPPPPHRMYPEAQHHQHQHQQPPSLSVQLPPIQPAPPHSQPPPPSIAHGPPPPNPSGQYPQPTYMPAPQSEREEDTRRISSGSYMSAPQSDREEDRRRVSSGSSGEPEAKRQRMDLGNMLRRTEG